MPRRAKTREATSRQGREPLVISGVVTDAPDSGQPAPDPSPNADITLHVGPDCPQLAEGTPVVAAGGQVGKVLSHDPITGQVQVAFEAGGRGWYRPKAIEVSVGRDG